MARLSGTASALIITPCMRMAESLGSKEITVEESLRNSGVGKALMERFEEWGRKLVALATRRAASFYKGIGYDESATFLRKLLWSS